MRVAIDAAALGSGQGGDETMLRGLLSGLAAVTEPEDRYDLVCRAGAAVPPVVAEHPSFAVHELAHGGGARYFAAALPRALRRLPRPDLVLAINHAPVWSPSPVVLMVQDLSFEHHPEHFPWSTRVRLSAVVGHQARRVHHVVTVSNFSRDDLVSTYGLRPERVSVIPNAIVEPPPFGDAEARRGRASLRELGVEGRFVLYLGNLHPRKNVRRLVLAFQRLREEPQFADVSLVVAGARWWGGGEWTGAPPNGVYALGPVDDEQREALLHLADVLVYPSIFEGFGLPPLEAMARGTPVVASNRTAIAETVGDGALTVEPTDVEALAEAIATVLSDASVSGELVVRGLARAARYSVEATGRAARAALVDTAGRHQLTPAASG